MESDNEVMRELKDESVDIFWLSLDFQQDAWGNVGIFFFGFLLLGLLFCIYRGFVAKSGKENVLYSHLIITVSSILFLYVLGYSAKEILHGINAYGSLFYHPPAKWIIAVGMTCYRLCITSFILATTLSAYAIIRIKRDKLNEV